MWVLLQFCCCCRHVNDVITEIYVCPLLSHVSLILPTNHNCLFLPQKLHQVLVQLQSGDKEQDFSLAPIQVSISVQLWRLPGCHEFLAALGESSTGGTKKLPPPLESY